MDLSIVIVSWRVKDLLRNCLKSVFEESSEIKYEVFVIDNDSKDGTVEMIQKEFPWVKLTASQENLGFAKGNNIGIRRAKGKYILLLNPDTIVLDRALTKCVHYLDENNGVDVLGCKLLYPDHSLQESCRRFPSFISQMLILLKLHNIFPSLGPIGSYYYKDFDYKDIKEVDQIMGASILARKEVFDEIGLLDEGFWAWFEEVDWCNRCKKSGKKIIFYPYAEIIHYKGQSFNKFLKRQLLFNQSMLYYFKKHHSFIEYWMLASIIPINLLLDRLVALILFLKIPITKKKNL